MKGLGHGQVWWADLDKVRPVVILTRARVASRLHRVLVAPITTTVRGIATEVPLGRAEGVKPGSIASLDNAHLLPIHQLVAPAGRIDPPRWHEFCDAMGKVMGC
ncbi:MAG: type II toxin-antitoxin system PemK/MazF family toxin [Actinomycetota bacterium]